MLESRDHVAQGCTEPEREGTLAPNIEGKVSEDHVQYRPQIDEADTFSDVQPLAKPVRWPTNTGGRLHIHRVAPESLYATEDRKKKARGRRLTPKKIETINLSIDMLQVRTFIHLHEHGMSDDAATAVPSIFAERLLAPLEELQDSLGGTLSDLRQLWKADDELTYYKRGDPGARLSNFSNTTGRLRDEATRELNYSLQRLFKQERNHEIGKPALLAKMCYNLSILPAAPDLETYNMLLLGLSKAAPALVPNVIRSIRETHIRPNEVTLSGILNYYVQTEDAEGFVRWFEIIRGKHNGLALARPGIVINDAAKGRLIRKENEPDKVIQLPYPTPMVFSALIAGALKFTGFESALRVCQSMGKEGWGLCMSGLSPLLEDCMTRGDWTSGLSVWQQIKALEAQSNISYRDQSLREKVRLETYASMLRLCSAHQQRSMFEEVWYQATRSYRISRNSLAEMLKIQAELPETSRRTMRTVGRAYDHLAVPFETLQGKMLDNVREMSRTLYENLTTLSNSPYHKELANEFAGSAPQTLEHTESNTKRSPGLDKDQDQRLDIADKPVPKPASRQRTHHQQLGQLSREQLDGLLPPSHELDDYELRERPMTMMYAC